MTATGVILVLLIGIPVAIFAEQAHVIAVHQEALAKPFDDAKFLRYLATLPRDGLYFVVEGDLLLTQEEVLVFLAGKSSVPVPIGPELTVNMVNGQRDYWRDAAQRVLTYAVARQSFPTEEQYLTVVANMRVATREWQDACVSCNVVFSYLAQHDSAPSHTGVVFIVRYYNSGGRYVAAAFFPNQEASRRYVNIDPSYFGTSFDKVGVLRHELGHVLGYRHEHIRGIAGCYQESGEWQPLTPYDAKSVMHYFCGGGGNLSLTLTDVDRSGHQRLYGPGH
jgi:hypothetical protein